MFTDLGPDDAEILAILARVVDLELEMPESVAAGARALHDWARLDAVLADLVEAQTVTRDAGTLIWSAQGVRIQVEVEPSGYRKRRLVLVAADDTGDVDDLVDIAVQLPDGSSLWVNADAFGERITRVPSGAVRVLARTPAEAVVTPWFTV